VNPNPTDNPPLGCALVIDIAAGGLVFVLLPACGVDVPPWVKIAAATLCGLLVLAALALGGNRPDDHQPKGPSDELP
jgi:hypothetical protein